MGIKRGKGGADIRTGNRLRPGEKPSFVSENYKRVNYSAPPDPLPEKLRRDLLAIFRGKVEPEGAERLADWFARAAQLVEYPFELSVPDAQRKARFALIERRARALRGALTRVAIDDPGIWLPFKLELVFSQQKAWYPLSKAGRSFGENENDHIQGLKEAYPDGFPDLLWDVLCDAEDLARNAGGRVRLSRQDKLTGSKARVLVHLVENGFQGLFGRRPGPLPWLIRAVELLGNHVGLKCGKRLARNVLTKHRRPLTISV